MQNFILEFHNTKFYFVSLVVNEMKRNLLTSMLVSWGFIFLKIVYTRFHLDETLLLSLSSQFLCHIIKKSHVAAYLLKMKPPFGEAYLPIDLRFQAQLMSCLNPLSFVKTSF
jgi:hypothetical protein